MHACQQLQRSAVNVFGAGSTETSACNQNISSCRVRASCLSDQPMPMLLVLISLGQMVACQGRLNSTSQQLTTTTVIPHNAGIWLPDSDPDQPVHCQHGGSHHHHSPQQRDCQQVRPARQSGWHLGSLCEAAQTLQHCCITPALVRQHRASPFHQPGQHSCFWFLSTCCS